MYIFVFIFHKTWDFSREMKGFLVHVLKGQIKKSMFFVNVLSLAFLNPVIDEEEWVGNTICHLERVFSLVGLCFEDTRGSKVVFVVG